MASTDGPYGISFEVPGGNLAQAIQNATAKAEAAGHRVGQTLYYELLSAGTWEIVLHDLGPEPETRTGYPKPKDPSEIVIRDFLYWLRDSTDTFDPVQLDIAIHEGISIKPDEEMIESWLRLYKAGA